MGSREKDNGRVTSLEDRSAKHALGIVQDLDDCLNEVSGYSLTQIKNVPWTPDTVHTFRERECAK